MRFMLRWGTSRMNWAWTTSLDQLWRSPAFPIWLTLAAAGFFGIILLVTLVRAEKSVANGALTVITLLAIGIAVAATIRGFGLGGGGAASAETPAPQTANATLPALSCIDDLAGEAVMTACEKVVFGSAEATAAAVSYAASRITRLTALGDAAANKSMTPDQQALRRSIERDRYGLAAQVLQVRDHCTGSDCAFFRFLTAPQQIAANIDARLYDSLVTRYAPSWNMPAAAAVGPVAALAPTMPTGKPTNADFPTSASIPPVSIMTPEPPAAAASPASRAPAAVATAPVPAPRPASTAPSTASTTPALAAAKKPPAKPRPAAPAQITPPAAPAAAPATAND
jgi:hypothetical protein